MTEFQDSFSEEVWKSTYKHHNENTIDETFKRVASAIASVEPTEELKKQWSERFFEMLSDFKVLPGGRILSNAGTEWIGTTLINCYVGPLPKEDLDSLDGILKVLRDQAQTLKSEGGWGMNFSWLRPRGSFIYGIGVETPGAVKYMELFDKASDIITSGSGTESKDKRAKGKIRKGAMMAILDVSHPDIVEFITAKQSPGRLTKFNMSVNCTDDFMEKVLQVETLQKEKAPVDVINSITWDLRFPETNHKDYKKTWDGDIRKWEEKGLPIKTYKTVPVVWLWNLIVESTYNRAEPGIIFLDRANRTNQLNYKEKILASNPCSEQMLSSGGLCNLISLNLTQMLKADCSGFDYKKIVKYVKMMVRFADNVNDYTRVPLPEYEHSKLHKRRIGCGIMGWASALYLLKVRFGSEEADKIRDEVMKTLTHAAVEASVELAREKGMFKECVPDKHGESVFWKQIGLPQRVIDDIKQYGIRNSSLFSIQPTGNSSIFANIVSGGLEPMFMNEYIRTVIVNTVPEHIADVTPKWYEGQFHETKMFKYAKEGDEQILKGKDANGIVYKIDKNRGLTKEVLCRDFAVRALVEKNQWEPTADWVVTTENLAVEDHLKDLIGFSKWLDSSCSKTINVPHNYPFEKFKTVYLDAYKSGVVKGVTTYRAGTMATVLSAKEEQSGHEEEIIIEDVKLPTDAPARMKTLTAEGRKWYLTVVYHPDTQRPFALFCHTNHPEKGATTSDAVDIMTKLAKKKGIPKRHIDMVLEKVAQESNTGKLTRMISLLLRHGVLIKNIVGGLDDVESVTVGSFLFQVKKYLSQYIKDGEKADGKVCDSCGGHNIVYSEGCYKCGDCGSSKCG